MKDWVKIQTFDRIHQAELRKQVLDTLGIPSVIVNERDSLFLMGDIELYVNKADEKKALAAIDEFKGLTKINSFIELKPIQVFQSILEKNGIQTTLKRKEDNRYIKDNYELYVKNNEIDEVLPYLTGEALTGWKKLKTCRKVRQTQYYIDILDKHLISALTVKKKDSNFHLSEIYIYVKDEDLERAARLTENLDGWQAIRHSEIFTDIEAFEENLANNDIQALIIRVKDTFSLFVKDEDSIRADEVLNLHAKWIKITSSPNIINAKYIKEALHSQGIPAVIVNEKDSSFLLGKIEILVEKRNEEKANNVIKEIQSLEN